MCLFVVIEVEVEVEVVVLCCVCMVEMEKLPVDICHMIFRLLDYQNLAASQQVCRKWKALTSNNILWSNLFVERWGEDRASFYSPIGSKSWKGVYEVQDRCDRVGLGLKIMREGGDYYLVHQGEIQQYLGSRGEEGSSKRKLMQQEGGILDNILFFVGDLEVASSQAKRRLN